MTATIRNDRTWICLSLLLGAASGVAFIAGARELALFISGFLCGMALGAFWWGHHERI